MSEKIPPMVHGYVIRTEKQGNDKKRTHHHLPDPGRAFVFISGMNEPIEEEEGMAKYLAEEAKANGVLELMVVLASEGRGLLLTDLDRFAKAAFNDTPDPHTVISYSRGGIKYKSVLGKTREHAELIMKIAETSFRKEYEE